MNPRETTESGLSPDSACVSIRCSVEIQESDDKGLWCGHGSAVVGFDLPGSRAALLHFLRWDQWYIDDSDEDWKVVTIEPDHLDWEADQLSLVEERAGRGGVIQLRCLRGIDMEELTLMHRGLAEEREFAIAAVLEWMESRLGLLPIMECEGDWTNPVERRSDISIVEALPSSAAVPNAAWRAQIRSTKLPWRIKHDPSGIELVLIPPASGYFGPRVADWRPGDGPRGRMDKITEPFYIAVNPFTAEAWHRLYVRQLPNGVPPLAAVANFDRAMTEQVLRKLRMELPTEAEWEFACRAGRLDDSPEAFIDEAWSAERLNRERPGSLTVAMLPPNGFGLHDMVGLVWEPTRRGGVLELRGGSCTSRAGLCTPIANEQWSDNTPPQAVGLRPILRVWDAGFPLI